jgi:Flp pilus assembly protein TadD
MTGRFALAKHAFDKALELAADYQRPTVMNDYAYLLATCPEPSIRNGPEAVRMAQAAIDMKGENSSFLDTLATAYAAVGRYNDAARAARRGIELAAAEGNQQAIRDLQDRAKQYEARAASGG